MQLSRFVIADTYVIENVHLKLGEYSTLTFICEALGIDLSKISSSDFDSASMALAKFIKSANDRTGYTVSVWFD